MTPEETQRLCRLIAALCPSQRFDDATPAVWQHVLSGMAFSDATAAVRGLARSFRYIAPLDLISAVRRQRDGRLAAAMHDWIPEVDPDDVPAYLTELRRLTAEVAAGRLKDPPPLPEIEDRDAQLKHAIKSVGRRPRR